MSTSHLLANRPAPIRILVANEPLAYRTALAATLRLLRPHLTVDLVAPVDLDDELARGRAALVFCSQLSEGVRTRARAWVLLYPNGTPRVETFVDGEQTILADLGLEAALALVDRVA